MLCTTICPNDAIYSKTNVLTVVEKKLQELDTIAITCDTQQQYHANEVVLPCLASLPGEAILYLNLSEKTIRLSIKEAVCASCHKHKSFQRFKKIFQKIASISQDMYGVSPSTMTLATDNHSEQASRRTFLKSLKQAILPRKQNSDLCQRFESNRRQISQKNALLNEAKRFINPAERESFADFTENRITVSDKCVPCNRCSAICPTGALRLIKRRNKKNLTFNSEQCSGCSLCTEFCKLEALVLMRSPLSLLLQEDDTLNKSFQSISAEI